VADVFEQIEIRVQKSPTQDSTDLAAWGFLISRTMLQEARRLKGAELREIVLVFERLITP
jgi:hypothetical protein